MARHTLEVQSRERFEFGRNWAWFLGSLNEERIAQARKSLSERLELESLQGHHPDDIRLADSPEAFAAACLELLGNAELRRRQAPQP
jgi:hypothetical protein